MHITTSVSDQACLAITAGAPLLNTYQNDEAAHADTSIRAKISFLGVVMINKNSLSWVGGGPT